MVEVRLPQSGMGMTDGTITAWRKTEGDSVIKGEILCEVEAAKTIVELECPETGILTRILVKADENVPVNTVIAEISAGTQPEPSRPLVGVASEGTGISGQSTPTPAADLGAGVQVEARARRLAKELGIDLQAVEGSGPGGRIVLEDVQAFAEQAPSAILPVSPAATTPPAGIANVESTTGAPSFSDVPHTMARRTIARRLTESKQQVPHFYLKAACAIDELLALRATINAGGAARITLNDLIVRAVALAMVEVPEANVSWGDQSVRRHHTVDVAVAVASARGLVTPIVRNVDRKALGEIATELKELAGRARESKLKPEEYNGGTVSVSNLGMYGVEEFSAILNPPQACIFAIGTGEQRAVVRDGKVGIATLMSVTISVDHRAVDGATAAQLLGAFKRLIEAPARIAGIGSSTP